MVIALIKATNQGYNQVQNGKLHLTPSPNLGNHITVQYLSSCTILSAQPGHICKEDMQGGLPTHPTN